MEMVETKKDKEWIIYPEGQKPIRMIVDKRIHGKPSPSNIGRGRPKAYLSTRTIRVPSGGVSSTALGHEVGHLVLEHKEMEPGTLVGSRFIREELEAEYWAYSTGLPRRKYKIEALRDLALDIGMTREEFNRIHRRVKGRLEGG